MKNKFNKTTLARLAIEGKPAIINDQVEKGLKFKAGPRRSVFIFEKRISGSKGAPITFTLGTFKALSISEARQEARRLATLCEKGIDPRVRQTDGKVITLELAIKTFLEINPRFLTKLLHLKRLYKSYRKEAIGCNPSILPNELQAQRKGTKFS